MLPDLAALEHFHFLRPAWGLLLVPWLLFGVLQNRMQSSREMFGGIIAPHLLDHLRLERSDSRWFNPRSFGAVVALLSLLILMGPSWRQQASPLSQDEAPLVVLLDVSSSMEQSDIQPSRLQRARQKISDLLALRADKKAALIAFAGSAHTVLTLTADQEILNQYLAAIKPGIMPRSGKFPEYALPLVDDILRQTTAPATVLLFTDGLGADSTTVFGDYFSQHSHQLLVAGVGTQTDEDGVVPLEDAALKNLASATGGRYLTLSVDDSDVRRIHRLIESHYVIVDDNALPWLDSGYVLVFPTMALFLLWFRKGWTLTWSWLLIPLALYSLSPAPVLAQEPETVEVSDKHWFADLWLSPDQQGRLLMQMGHYPEAASRFQDPMWKGMAYYYAEDFLRAAEYFARSDSDDALFNEANARAHARDYLRSVHRYDRLLKRTPDYPGAAQNRQRVQDLIDEINRISASQQEEAGVSSEEKTLDGDDAIPAEGADQLTWEKQELVQFSAEEVLQDPATRDMWMRGVQQDPSHFLAIKFNMQLNNAEEATP